jgi:hypothetical protein
MKLGSWLHSIPRSSAWNGIFRVECFWPLEIKEMRFSNRRFEWPIEREREPLEEYGYI